ncbi:MAG: hypothetical protein PHT46_04630 [Candidatus Marinimicrobia bacterium]|nr:hypothetical protein [Candidatus Neomarinimicrobiota bacterium]MDD5709937.1 hypothetical protein [Candidatus Neomarinimicrobiota bacterium]MDX9778415.1 hypothetical protein [bacterium]
MVRSIKYMNGILGLLFLPFIPLAVLLSQDLLHSLFFILWLSLFAILNILLLFLKGKIFSKLIHGALLGLLILMLIAIPQNKPQSMILGKGGEYLRVFQEDTLRLSLLDFRILHEANKLNYELVLKVNADTLHLQNRPFMKISHLQILDISHVRALPFRISQGDSIILYEGQSGTLQGTAISLEHYNPELELLSLRYHGVLFNVPAGETISFMNRPLSIVPLEKTFAIRMIFQEQHPFHFLLNIAFLIFALLNGILAFRREGDNSGTS